MGPVLVGLDDTWVVIHSVTAPPKLGIFALGCNVAVREAQLRRHYCYLKTKSKPRLVLFGGPANFWSLRATNIASENIQQKSLVQPDMYSDLIANENFNYSRRPYRAHQLYLQY